MNYKIPLFDLNFDEKEEQAVIEVLRSHWISTGPKTIELEEKFAEMLGSRYAVALTNCTVALHLAMIISEIGKGDEVICPSLSFVATANAIRYVNATPVFADICNTEDLTIDPLDIERKITSRTKAIIVMHYGGFPCHMSEIAEIARRHNLKIIEDACHGPLSEYNGKKLGTIGDIGCFSFFSNKNISTGEGGMLITDMEETFKRAKLLRSHGMTTMSYERASGHSTSYDVTDTGFNFRMDDIRASLGIVQLEKLKNDLLRRAGIRELYLSELKAADGISVPFSRHKGFVSNYIFPVILKNPGDGKREAVRQYLASRGIQTSVHYPAIHKFSTFETYRTSPLLVTEYVADNLITLPMYAKLGNQDVIFITETLKEAVAKC